MIESHTMSEASAEADKLLVRFIAGDDAAFESLFEKIGQRLFAFILQYMRDYHRAEDVYQAVCIKVATKASMYEKRTGALAWIFQIARNACIDELRTIKRHPSVSLDAPTGDATTFADLMMAHTTQPGDEATKSELGMAILTAVESLPDPQREVFLLREEADLSFEEISGVLGINKDTAKSRMRYALERLRNALGREAREYAVE